MKNYDYHKVVKESIYDYIANIADTDYETLKYNRDSEEEKLYDEMFISDSVTGNGSGSYTFSRQEAWENLYNNYDLLAEALDELNFSSSIISQGWEACDVTIRCHLLGQYITEVIDEILEDWEAEEE